MKNSFLENLNQGVLGLQPYEPGLPLEHTQKKLGLEKMIKLASNENPLGPSTKALDLLQAKMNSFSSELNRYPDGNAYDLQEAISKKYDSNYQVSIDPNLNVVNTIGSKEGLTHLLMSVLNPGDKVVVQDPSYPLHHFAPLIARAETLKINCLNESDFLTELVQI